MKREAEIATLQNSVTAHLEMQELLDDALRSEQIAASQSYARLSVLDEKVSSLEDYISTLEDSTRVCLDRNDTDRVRDLLKAPNGSGSGSPKAPPDTK